MNQSYNIFIVDDDTFLLTMYRKKFEALGCVVEVASSPIDALDKLRNSSKPDIILLDVIMPGMDGLELLSTIRKENLSENATIIVLTNESDSAKIQEAKSLKVDGYIIKATGVPSDVAEQVLKIAETHHNKN
jgi:CheY-like chemotaxis protein